MKRVEDIQPIEPFPGFKGRFVHGDRSTLSFWNIKKGSVMPEHHHVHEQITHILEGELEMLIGGVKYVFTSGMVHVIHSNVPHSAVALKDCIVIDSFSPVRNNYE